MYCLRSQKKCGIDESFALLASFKLQVRRRDGIYFCVFMKLAKRFKIQNARHRKSDFYWDQCSKCCNFDNFRFFKFSCKRQTSSNYFRWKFNVKNVHSPTHLTIFTLTTNRNYIHQSYWDTSKKSCAVFISIFLCWAVYTHIEIHKKLSTDKMHRHFLSLTFRIFNSFSLHALV